MKILELNQEIFEYKFEELPPDEQELILVARKATAKAYSPYSKFNVGCAVKLTHGVIYGGANKENASHSVTSCAERSTLDMIHNLGHTRDVEKIAVTGFLANAVDKKGDKPLTPCGVCRQEINETEELAGRKITILMDCFNDDLIYKVVGISNLLPLSFGPKDLGISL